MIYLDSDFQKEWNGKDPFEEAFRLEGEVFRSVKTRRTFRFALNGKNYFAKVHHGIGWTEILKNLLQFKRPVTGARNEYEAIRRLDALGVSTMKVAAFGECGRNPARKKSFIITDELCHTVSLEDFCRDRERHPPPVAFKRDLIRYLAEVSRTLHRNGVNHRDYYICHFLMDLSAFRDGKMSAALIDLHRAQLRRKTPRRWVVKDVAGLYFSAMDIGLTRRDLFRFIKTYSDRPLREILRKERTFWRSVERTASRLYSKENGGRAGR